MNPHDEFLELCAISTSGSLSDAEQKKLEEHLACCSECRQALDEFNAVATFGVPLLFGQLSEEDTSQACPISSELNKDTILFAARRSGHKKEGANWKFVWLSYAAAILLIAALGAVSYRIGRGRGLVVARSVASAAAAKVDTLEQQLSDAAHEREILEDRLADGKLAISILHRRIKAQSAALDEIRTAQANLERSDETEHEANRQMSERSAMLAQQLDAAQAALGNTEAEFDALQQQRAAYQAKASGLQSQINGLSAELREQAQTIGEQSELLSHDRDIRELMGARQLYISEIYDIGRDGKSKKPFGRIFYTRGKSLVFYAYDLDQQPGLRGEHTFQVWGERGLGDGEALNLGIFYQDNAAKRRWVLKFDNPKELAEINAVFVTVEPKGGSDKPTGKHLLYADLVIKPNHP